MKYEPTFESVNAHVAPKWYEDAKFGIFVHWSLFSVPCWSPFDGRSIMELMSQYGQAYTMKHNPYAEWYLNSLRIEGSPTREHHAKVWGEDFPYFNFQKLFEERSKDANFSEWANVFADCGAKYVVLVTKHHDGYCLWPSAYKNPAMPDYQSKRDIVGELTDAVRAKGMRMGLYYSGIFDWTFKDFPIDSEIAFIKHTLASDEYAAYATRHIYELVERYKPDVLWNDIGYPAQTDLNKLFADYYNAVPDGVINNRWSQTKLPVSISDAELKEYIEKNGNPLTSLVTGATTHCDFTTPEYMAIDKPLEQKFESTRGIGLSFGYNSAETEKEMIGSDELIHLLVDVVSKNGNLLLNVGPMATGEIPAMQLKPLRELGKWLKVNGESIYGTRPWKIAQSKTDSGEEVRFTQKDGAVYATVLSPHLPQRLVIKDFAPAESAKASLLGCGEVKWSQEGNNAVVELPGDVAEERAYSLKFV
jgi:alpha-L-fucosidase